MAPRILPHDGLTDAQIRSIERQQFLPLDTRRKEWYENQIRYYESLFLAQKILQESQHLDAFIDAQGDGAVGVNKRAGGISSLRDLAVNKNGYRLTARAFATVVNARNKELMREANQESMTDTYVQMICHYTSWVRAGFVHPSRRPSCAMLPSADLTALKRSLTQPKENPMQIAHNILAKAGLAGDAFLALDFLFIPWVNPDARHVVLAGLAPTQRFAFVIDSIPGTYRASTSICIALKTLILSQTCEADFRAFAADNRTARPADGEWRLYGQWSQRATGTQDDSPDGPQQHDTYNCGVFAATTAFCLAFGYRLNCFSEADLDALKKPRMAAEFGNGGFAGESFNYDLLELRRIVGRSAQPQPEVQESKPGLLERIFGSLSQDEQGILAEEAESASDGETGRTSPDSDSFNSSLPFTEQPFYTPSQLSALRALAHTSTTTHPAEKDEDTTPFPFQFDPTQHKRAILVYGRPDGLHVQERRYSKRELKRVCRDFGLRRWRRYSRARREVFARWVVSEVAGVVGRWKGNVVGPAPGVGELKRVRREGDEGEGGVDRKGSKRRRRRRMRKVDEGQDHSRIQPKRSVKRKRQVEERERSKTPCV